MPLADDLNVQVTVWPRGKARAVEANTSGDGAQFVSSFGTLTAASFSTLYGPGIVGGEDQLEFTFVPNGGYGGGLFRASDHVELSVGGIACGQFEFSGARVNDDESVTCTATGYRYKFGDYDAMNTLDVEGQDPLLYPTLSLDEAWTYDRDIRVWPISPLIRGMTIPYPTLGESPFEGSRMADRFLKMVELVVPLAENAGKRATCWGRQMAWVVDDLTPRWLFEAPDTLFGVADSDYYSTVFFKYLPDPDDPEYPDTLNPDGSMMLIAVDQPTLQNFDERTIGADWTPAGPLFRSVAVSTSVDLVTQTAGRYILDGSITVGPDDGFKSANGGIVTILAQVTAGDAIHLPGIRVSDGRFLPGDGVYLIGETEWSWSVGNDEQLTVVPMGAVPRDLASILAAPQGQTALSPDTAIGL